MNNDTVELKKKIGPKKMKNKIVDLDMQKLYQRK